MKKKPITEIILAVVLVVSLAAFLLLKDTGSGTQSHGESVGQESNTTENQDGMSDYEKDHQLVNADAEDERTEKRLYLYSMFINKEIYFKYFVGHIGDNIKYGGYADYVAGTKGPKYVVCQLRVDSVEKYDEYEGLEKNEGEKFVKVTYDVTNLSESPYIWRMGDQTVSFMNEEGEIEYGLSIPRYYEYGFEPTFCDYSVENKKTTYFIADYKTGRFVLPVGTTCSYSIIYTLSEEGADEDNLVAARWDESVKKSRDGVTFSYTNDGYRIYLNQ